ncbi:MAG: hypothetical protein IGR93_18865 [Hydrococcus sp. C42_A2020_068]|uniref:hypothetical protein n=1 Tax=Pleurocapsa sp. PCC 7327 TaxID=118163 RepID=UPI00029FD2A3|nr:hypothetical protein [Pleurocapsa sp. PCC 7327]AFY75602.1 hypothetical protein Ple7327_0118 [Pleurocapsa sp. PCC 7327]MBF2022095.1 hypothetical protein [Hydrococcus sp. C42_A2020_068]
MKTSRQSPLPASLWLSLATTPFLFGMLAFRSLTQSLIELGQASEEVFRGDRLPILNFPEPDDQAIDN